MRLIRIINVAAAVFVVFGPLHADGTESIGDSEFEKLHGLIKRQQGESRWMELDWYPSVWEARKKAAEEGKQRPGQAPFGFAFELAKGSSPTDRIPPGGNVRYVERHGYFAASR